MKAAIYARYSSENQDRTSNETQIAACRKWAKEHAYEVSEEHIYADAAISGRCPNRPGIDALIAAAPSKSFDVVLVFTTDRVARNSYGSLGFLYKLEEYDISLVFVGEGYTVDDDMSRAFFQFRSIFAEMASDANRRHTIRGQQGKVERGYIVGSVGYGYRLEKVGQKRIDATGRVRAEGSIAVIVEEQAEVIRRVFSDFVSPMSMAKIVQALNEEGVPSHYKGGWNESTVSKMLKNEKYIGRYVWRKTSNRRSKLTGKADKKDNDPSMWVTYPHPEMRIVSDELWDAVQLRLRKLEEMYPASSKQKGFKKQTKSYVEVYPDYLLSGALKCAKCGGAFVQVSGRHFGYYGCQMAHKRKRCDCRKRIPRLKLEDRVINVVQEKALNLKALEVVAAAASKAMKEKFSYLPKQLKAKQKDLIKVDREIAYYISAIAKGIESSTLAETLAKAEEKRRSLKADIESLGQAITRIPEAPTIEQIKQKLSNLKELLQRNTEKSALKLREYLGPITLKLMKNEQGKEYYLVKTRVHTFPFLFFTEKGATSLEWWRCRESNPGPERF